ncbi:hypothetical protein CDAR_479551 [Caerostris darwini]|uniref:Uncharacterized protein n=1 Tax=Caerostris darwini TaxID=1538125 RepID=A0AAV4MS25_9ARAC|nr:hypothetical protein CDAR_479551 [Caerostris darwini]
MCVSSPGRDRESNISTGCHISQISDEVNPTAYLLPSLFRRKQCITLTSRVEAEAGLLTSFLNSSPTTETESRTTSSEHLCVERRNEIGGPTTKVALNGNNNNKLAEEHFTDNEKQ